MSWLQRILLAALLVALFGFGPRAFELVTAPDDLPRIEGERDELQAKNAALRDEIGLLRAEVKALQEDTQEIARIARQDLNLSAPGDIVFEVEVPTRTKEADAQ